MGLAAGDHERVAAGGQAAQEAFLGRGGEVELRQRRVAQRRDLGDQRTEAVGVLLGADDVDAELVRRGRQLDAAADHQLAVVDRRHQPRLRVDDEEGAVLGLAENGHCAGPGVASPHFPPTVLVSAQCMRNDLEFAMPMNTAASASAQTFAAFQRRSLDDRDGFWAEQAALIDWQRPFTTVCDDEPAAVRALVRRRPHQPVPQRGRPPSRDARRPARADLRLDRDRAASRSTASPSCTPRCSAWRRCCSRSACSRATAS